MNDRSLRTNSVVQVAGKNMCIFADEYPADIYQSDLFCFAVVHSPGIDNKTPYSEKERNTIIASNNLIVFFGWVQKTDLINRYKKDPATAKGKYSGVNTLWSAALSYSTICFIRAFLKGNPPPISLYYDPKSMSNKHRSSTHTFLQRDICEFHKNQTGHNLDITVSEGSKDMMGIMLADQIVRSFFAGQGQRHRGNNWVCVQNLTGYLEKNVRENPQAFT